MDQLHDPVIKQCIASLALNNNFLRHTSSDNFCFIKHEHAMNHQPSKTVSLYLTRLPNASSSYVHVLRCNICDHLTLNTSDFKEHFRVKHPSSLGFWTYSCCQCSSLSTEKSLMEEHLKLYHRVNDGPAGKLIERFHEPNANEPPTGITQAASIPPTLNSSGASSLAPSGLSFNLFNAIQNAGRNQTLPLGSPFASKLCTVNGPLASVSPPSISSPLSLSPPEVTSPVVERNPEVKTDDPVSVVISTEAVVGTMGVSGYCVSGSRRRKATTPGRICPRASTNTASDEQSDNEEEIKTNELQPTCKPAADGFDTVVAETSVAVKRVANTCAMLPVTETPDDTISASLPPSSKRFCTSDVSRSDFTTTCVESRPLSKTQLTASNLPFILSIANAIDGSCVLNDVKPSNSSVPLCSQSMGPLQNYGPTVMGQLIPISGLPDHLLCSNLTALASGSAGINNPPLAQSLINTPVTFSLPMVENQQNLSNSGAASAWLLTNQANLNAVPSTVGTFQPTLLVPVPATINESLPLSNLRTVSASSMEVNPSGLGLTGHTSSVVRLSDLLDALRSVAAGGNLVTSVSVPLNNPVLTTTLPTSELSDATSQDLLRTSGQHQLREDNPLVTEPAATTTVSTNLGQFLCNLSSSSIVTAPVLSGTTSSPPAANTTSVNALLNQLVMAAVAAVNATSASFDVTRDTSNSGRANVTGALHDQALDMSVRSVTTPIGGQVDHLSVEADVIRSSEPNQTTTGVKKMEHTDNISVVTTRPKTDSSEMNSVNGVVEILNAALKGGLKQRLNQSCESTSASITPSVVQCLAASSSMDRLTNSSSDSASVSILATDANAHGLLKGSPNTPHATLPLSNQSFEGNSVLNSVGSMGESAIRTTTSSIGVLCGGNPTILTSQPQLINLSQLQAIMSAMANGASVSVATPLSNAAMISTCSSPVSTNNISGINLTDNKNSNTNATLTYTVPTLHPPNLSAMTTTTAFSQAVSHPMPSLLPTSQVLIDASSLSATPLTALGSTQLPGHESTSTLLMPSTLANVGTGLTLAADSGAILASSSLSSAQNVHTTFATSSLRPTSVVPSNEGLSLANVLSSSALTSQPCVTNQTLINLISSTSRPPATPQNNVALSSAAAARLLNSLTGLTSSNSTGLLPVANAPTTIGTPHGTILGTAGGNMFSLIDSPQALLAAAAAAAAAASASGHLNVNQVALASLRGSIMNNNNTSSGAQRTVGSTGSVIGLLDPRTGIQLRVADVSGVSPTTSSHLLTPSELASCLSSTASDAFLHSTDSTNGVRETDHSRNGGSEKRRKCAEIDLMRPVEGESHSPYDNHLDDDWDSGQDDASIVQANLQSIYSAGKKADPSIGSDGSSPSLCGATPTFLSSTNRRSTTGSSSRLSTTGTSGRRGITSLSDSMQLGRPHRQNFTPTQNRILTEWYQTHQTKPYPSTDDTKELANISGLSYSQVKKWFANKRARSSSSGLPKPTPPLASDSSPDPSTAAAIVAAAMAAATSATSISDMTDCGESVHPYLMNSQSLSAPTTNSPKIESDMTNCMHESEPFDGNLDQVHYGKPEFGTRTTSHDDSCPSTDDEEPPLTVVSDPREDKVDVSSTAIDDLQKAAHPDRRAEAYKHRSHPGGSIDQAASPPTLQVFLSPRIVSPVSRHTNSDSPDEQIPSEDPALSENVVVREQPSSESGRTKEDLNASHESVLTQKSKGLRSRGVVMHAS